MVLYSIVKSYNSFFCDILSYCTAGFHVELSITSQSSVAMSQKHKTESGTEVLQTQT